MNTVGWGIARVGKWHLKNRSFSELGLIHEKWLLLNKVLEKLRVMIENNLYFRFLRVFLNFEIFKEKRKDRNRPGDCS